MTSLTSTIPIVQQVSQPREIQEPTKKEYHVTQASLERVTEGRPIVVSYGYTKTGWNETNEAMKRLLGEDNVWNYFVGQSSVPDIDPSTNLPKLNDHGQAIIKPLVHTSSTGADLIKITVPEAGTEGVGSGTRGTIAARRQCKAGLINTIFHNYCMAKNNKDDFIPIIFSTDLSDVWGKQKSIEKDSRTTCSEIELLRKLCTDTDLPEDFRELARKTVKFIDVREEGTTDFIPWDKTEESTRTTTYSFKETDAPWEVTGYDARRAQVKQAWLAKNSDFQRPEGSKGESAPKAFGWKAQLLTLIEPGMGFIPDPDEIELEVAAETTTTASTQTLEELTPYTTEEETTLQPAEAIVVFTQ